MTAAVVTHLVPSTPPVPRQRRVEIRPVSLAPFQGSLPLRWSEEEQPQCDPHLPDLHGFAKIFAKVLIDVLNGDRGVHHLLRWTTEDVYADLSRRTNALRRAAPQGNRRARLRAQVRSVHVSSPRPGVGEVSVHVRHGQRSKALCCRIQLVRGRWQCSVLVFG